MEATEEDHASALRQTETSTAALLRRAPQAYWDTLSQLRKAQAVELAQGGAAAREEVLRLKRELEAAELRSGLYSSLGVPPNSPEKNIAPPTLRNIQQGLRPGEALLSFHTGRDCSALWAVTPNRIQLYRLPPEPVLAKTIAAFKEAVVRRQPDRDSLARTLYTTLFGRLSAEVRGKKTWVVSADDSFFEVPLVALVTGTKRGKPVYLVEEHCLLRTPSAAILDSAPKPASRGPFLGMGDGIYNQADPRWLRAPRQAGLFPIALFAAPPSLQLPRLPGSRKEVDACARNWNDPSPVLLFGRDASRSNFQAAALRRPSVIHIASHYVSLPQRPDEVLIDVGLDSNGAPELLNEKDIAGLQVPGATVVMSGCSSGESRSISTSGVMGLTRAWFIAGARAVIGSRWSTKDDSGELFQAFYSRLSLRKPDPARTRSVAMSLQEAQIEMLRSDNWRSDPSYWGAFYAIGKE